MRATWGSLAEIFRNVVLIAALSAWVLSQALKLPIAYARKHEWNWALLFGPGGMPSSHSALVAATATEVGLVDGFGSPSFALALTLAMVVVYDAAGVRRQAGLHAQTINAIVNQLLKGQPPAQGRLQEVLGHSPGEVGAGVGLGIIVAVLVGIAFS